MVGKVLLPFQFTGPLKVLMPYIPRPLGITKSHEVCLSLHAQVTYSEISVTLLQIARDEKTGQSQFPVAQSLLRPCKVSSEA